MAEPAGAVRKRRRQGVPRPRTCMVRLSDAEHAEVSAAAARAGLTPAGFCAEAALGAARAGGLPTSSPAALRGALVEVMDARDQAKRLGSNLNQAVAALHSTGEPPAWLGAAVERAERAVARLDAAGDALVRRLAGR